LEKRALTEVLYRCSGGTSFLRSM